MRTIFVACIILRNYRNVWFLGLCSSNCFYAVKTARAEHALLKFSGCLKKTALDWIYVGSIFVSIPGKLHNAVGPHTCTHFHRWSFDMKDFYYDPLLSLATYEKLPESYMNAVCYHSIGFLFSCIHRTVHKNWRSMA